MEPTTPTRVVLAGFSGTTGQALAARLRPVVPPAADYPSDLTRSAAAGAADPGAPAAILIEPVVADVEAGPEQVMACAATAGVLVLGAAVSGRQACDLIEVALADRPGESPQLQILVLAAGHELAPFAELVAADRILYLSPGMPELDDVVRLVRTAVSLAVRTRGTGAPTTPAAAGSTPAPPAMPPAMPDGRDDAAAESAEGALARSLLGFVRRLESAGSPGAATTAAAQAVPVLISTGRARCLLWDQTTDTLWRETGDGTLHRESAAAGLAAFVLRTGVSIRIESIGDDPRWDPGTDSADDSPDDRLLAVPIPGRAGRPAGVLVAIRSAGEPVFDAAEQHRLERGAELLTPLIVRLELEDQALRSTTAGKIFRRAVLDTQTRGRESTGRVLELAPDWLHRSYRLLLVVVACALAFTVLGTSSEYTSGPAVILDESRVDVTAQVAATATEILVQPGERVHAGQLLVRFYGAGEAAVLQRVRDELEAGLLARLRDPTDRGAEQTLVALRAEKQLAEARLDQLSVRAPRTGVISDLRIRPGQPLGPGDVILTLTGTEPELEVLAFLAGRARPQVRPGMPLRLELDGYPYAYQQLRIDRVGEEVLGPAEARRLLEPAVADAVPLTGPVVFVRATIDQTTFTSNGQVYRYHDGMVGRAEVRVRSERLIFTLLPALRLLTAARPSPEPGPEEALPTPVPEAPPDRRAADAAEPTP